MLVACWPLAVGQIGQNVLRDGVRELNNSDWHSEIVQYDRGYLSSVAVTKLTIENADLKEQLRVDGLPTEFVLEHKIKHGLLGLSADTELVDMSLIPAKLHTETKLNGNTKFTLDIDTVHYEQDNQPGSSVYLAKSQIKGSATVLGELDLEFVFPSVQFQFDNGESISISGISGNAKGKKVNGFWHGEQEIKIDDTSLLTSQGIAVTNAKAFSYKFSSSLNETGDRINTNHLVNAQSILSNQEEIDGLNLDFTLGELDTASFEHLVGLYHNKPVIDDKVLAQSAPVIDTLFSKGFLISMNELKLGAGGGSFTSKWHLEVPEGTDNVTQDFSKIIPAMTGKLDSLYPIA